ncbi:MAG: hypothetical protein EP338_14345 [Bacteroidetes bacterium]|nr:MAG: hypothetical protein EP338_14345 [Bacteroidota bacterium]
MRIFIAILASLFIIPVMAQREKLPELNQQVLKYVDQQIGKKVGRGECWDLAQEALDGISAKWDGNLKFGRLINPKREAILPGDIIQFEKVRVKFQDGNFEITENYQHHTAIVYEVEGKTQLQIAQQNTSYSGKKVAVSPLDLKNIDRGKIFIYRPTK